MPRPDPRYPLIVFDWDGTLMDSASAIVASIQEASRELGLEVPTRERASHVIGLGLHDSLRHAVPALPESGYPEFVAIYRRHFLARESVIEIFDGIPEMLRRLRSRGHWLAVATGKSRKGLDRALDTSGLGEFFVSSRCADETSPKPHPAMLHELMIELDYRPEQLLMIGDTSHDLGMARNAGVDALAVTYGAHPADSLHALQPRGVVNSVADLESWLERHA
jgi:phosphoglycolate phosphatase